MSRPLESRARPLPSGGAIDAAEGTDRIPTVRLAAVTGAQSVDAFDPTEDYHEASRMYSGVVDPTVAGAARLERSLDVRVSASRSVKRHAQLPSVPLGARELGIGELRGDDRRPPLGPASSGHGPCDLSSSARSCRRATESPDGSNRTPQELRSAPSGGALYPLELYVVARRVDGVAPGLYHFDPLRNCLERLRPERPDSELDGLSPYGELLRSSAGFVAMTAMFWRSRFKYGARAYRFTLLEAGHVAQNMLLAVAALGLAAVPIGGFYDREVDSLLGVDGLYEASLYLLPLGAAE